MKLNEKEVLRQSKSAMRQWEPIWRKNAKENGALHKGSGKLTDLLYKGKGKTAVVCAYGHTFEEQLEIIDKKDRDYDIITVDKCAAHFKNPPDYVLIQDAGIPTDWMKELDSSNSTLIANVISNPEWTKSWKGEKYFHVNKDNIDSHVLFSELSGCKEMMVAASNVGNTAVVFASTIMNYDRIILVGYDFCFDNQYYAFHDSEKRYWMNHRLSIDNSGRVVKTSENLVFSAKWLSDFIRTIPTRVMNATKKSILHGVQPVNLKWQLKKAQIRKITDNEKAHMFENLKKSIRCTSQESLKEIAENNDVVDIVVSILPKEYKWIL